MRTRTRDTQLAVVAVCAFVALTVALTIDGPLTRLDVAVHAYAEQHRPGAIETAGRVLNRLGQGGALLGLCAVLAVWLAVRHGTRRASWSTVVRPLAFVAVAAVLVVPTVLALKAATTRGAPSSPLPPERTVSLLGPLPAGEYAAGYPGGHAVNAVVWYGVLLALVTALLAAYGRRPPGPAVRVAVRVVPPVLIVATTVYLSFHWLTDSVAGLLFGVAVDRVLAALSLSPATPAARPVTADRRVVGG